MPRPVYSEREKWLPDAKCRGMNPSLFFPSVENAQARVAPSPEAVAACQACPVLEQCADWAVKHEPYGYQGGMTEKQRAAVRRRMNILLWEPQHNITSMKPTHALVNQRPIPHGTSAGYKMELKRGFAPCAPCRAAQVEQSRQSKQKAKLLKSERDARVAKRMAELEAERMVNAAKREAAKAARRAAREASQ